MYTQKDLQRIMHELNKALATIDKRLTALEQKSNNKSTPRRTGAQKKELDK